MMKKLLLSVFILFVGALFTDLSAQGVQNIPLQIINESPIGSNNTKTPLRPMYISQDDNILTLPATSVDYTLELRDENGIAVYTDYLPTGTTQVVLPSTLSGYFEIRLVADTYYYMGYIYV